MWTDNLKVKCFIKVPSKSNNITSVSPPAPMLPLRKSYQLSTIPQYVSKLENLELDLNFLKLKLDLNLDLGLKEKVLFMVLSLLRY